MSHTRPSGAGWVSGLEAEPVEVATEPPGDGIGPDLQPPDRIPGQDGREAKRLATDYRQAVKDTSATPDAITPELHESAEEPRTADPFADARAREPQEPATEVPEDPREDQRSR